MDEEAPLPEGVELDYDEASECYRVRYDQAERPASTVVTTAVAVVLDVDPTDLEPLRAVLDPDALDDLFARTPGGHPRDAGSIEFALADHWVVVKADGEIELCPLD